MDFLKNIPDFRRTPIRDAIIDAMDYAFERNSPESRVFSFLERREDLSFEGNLYVVGFGKAGRGMFRGVKKFLGDRISNACIIVPREGNEEFSYPFLPGDHPLPSSNTIESSSKLIDSLEKAGKDDLVIVLISGGGSSLFEVLRNDVQLEEYNETIRHMMKNGANIEELNAIRYLFSKTKGGGLLSFTRPARVLSLVISDVPGDSVDTVASGPTGDPPKRSFVEKTVKKFCKDNVFPNAYREPDMVPYRSDNRIILKNSNFVDSICERLATKGSEVVNLGSGIEDSTISVAKLLVDKMRSSYADMKSELFVVGGGETSTKFSGSGIGGRNLELTLRVLLLMDEHEKFAFGSIGTDGVDGSSNAMGAIADEETLKILGKEFIEERLSKSESLFPLESTRDVLHTGPTGTNVSDIFIGYYAGKGQI